MALNNKNIIVGAARLYIGPSATYSQANGVAGDGSTGGAVALTSPSLSRPPFVAGTKYATTMAGADGSGNGTDPTVVNNWREVGYTQNGLAVANNPTWGEVQVDQLLDSARIFKDTMTFNVTTTLAENTLENVLVAWGQASSTLYSSGSDRALAASGGALGDPPLERGLIAIGNGTANTTGVSPAQKELVYQLYRVLSVDSVTTTYARSEPAVLPVNFRCLPANDGTYGVLRERSGALT